MDEHDTWARCDECCELFDFDDLSEIEDRFYCAACLQAKIKKEERRKIKAEKKVVPTGPRRVKRSRQKGSRLPRNTVSVTRPGRWGNPFTVMEYGVVSVDLFEAALQNPDADFVPDEYRKHLKAIVRNIHHLTGKNLACFCELDQECHGDVLLKLANEPNDEAAQ